MAGCPPAPELNIGDFSGHSSETKRRMITSTHTVTHTQYENFKKQTTLKMKASPPAPTAQACSSSGPAVGKGSVLNFFPYSVSCPLTSCGLKGDREKRVRGRKGLIGWYCVALVTLAVTDLEI